MLKPAWTIVCYARSEVEELNEDKVATVFSVTFVLFGDKMPSKGTIEGMFHLHCKNAELLVSEQTFTPFDEQLFPGM